jgi:hypothetical protein
MMGLRKAEGVQRLADRTRLRCATPRQVPRLAREDPIRVDDTLSNGAGGQTRSVWRAVEQLIVEQEKAGICFNRFLASAFAEASADRPLGMTPH